MFELLILFLKILLIDVILEGIVYGAVVIAVLIYVSNIKDEERMLYEGDRLSEED